MDIYQFEMLEWKLEKTALEEYFSRGLLSMSLNRQDAGSITAQIF